jgi:hypothetical protein
MGFFFFFFFFDLKDIFEKDKKLVQAPIEPRYKSTDSLPMAYPDEMILNAEILGINSHFPSSSFFCFFVFFFF